MTTAATITGRMLLDTSDYDRKIDQAESKASTFQSNMQTIGSKLAKIGGGMTAGLTVPIIGAGTAMVNAASDLEESQNAVNVVFGESSRIIDEYGQTSATSVGLARSEFNQLSAVTGSFLQNLGYGAAGAAEESINLTERAADMASVFNTDVSSALAAIQSGLKGEFNPLEAYGVKINQAAIETKAYAMGLADAEGNLDDNAKAQAALALIMEQTDRIAGDFTNTSDGLANSTRIMKAQLSDAAAQLGQQLLPYITKGVEFISSLVEKFQSLNPEQQKWIVIIGVVIAAIGPLITIIGGLVSAIGAIAGVVGAVSAPILIIIAVVALLALAWKNNWGGIQEKTKAVWAKIQPVIQTVVAWLKEHIPQAIARAKEFWDNVLLPAIKTVWNWIQTNLLPLFKAVGDVLTSVVGFAVKVVGAYITNILVPAVKVMWQWFNDKIMPIIKVVAAWLGEKLKPAFEGISRAIQGVTGFLSNLANGISNLSLPDWLTPGSPTPFELGLRGINKEMDRLASGQLPSLNAGLNMNMMAPATVGAGSAGNSVVFQPGSVTINDPITGEKFIEMFKRMMNGDLG